MVYAVRVEEQPAVRLAVVRHRVSAAELAQVVPESCGLVWQAVKAQQTEAGRHVSLYLDDAIHVEIGVEILGLFVDDEDVVCSATPGGLVAATAHLGPYGTLGAAHDAIHQWCATHGHRLAGPRWEIYEHWRPEWDADPSQIRTDICYLLA